MIRSKQDILHETLVTYFTKNPEYLNIIIPILFQKSIISLRLLDWLITNYSKKYNIVYDGNGDKPFNIFLNYKNQLKAYSKKFFDPFCRRNRIDFPIKQEYLCEDVKSLVSDNSFSTTIGQLNFFRWAIDNKIIDYAYKNHENIENDMITTIQERNAQKKNNINIPKKRKELSKSLSKLVNKQEVKILIKFTTN